MRPCSRNICLTLIFAICAETSNSLASRMGKIGADRLTILLGIQYAKLQRQGHLSAPNCVESIADCSEIIRYACGCILDFGRMPKVHVWEKGGPSLALSDSEQISIVMIGAKLPKRAENFLGALQNPLLSETCTKLVPLGYFLNQVTLMNATNVYKRLIGKSYVKARCRNAFRQYCLILLFSVRD